MYFRPHRQQTNGRILLQNLKRNATIPAASVQLMESTLPVQQPSYSGSELFNCKHFYSVILVALVDTNYKFLYVDIGAAGRASDDGVYGQSTLKKAIASNSLDLPGPTLLQEIPGFRVHYHIVGDDAFPMSENLMKPYPQRSLEVEKRIFNYRLSRTRRVVENAFGILTHRWRVFLQQLKCALIN